MRGRTAVAVAALGVAFALGGCGGLPPGVDGDLNNGWPAMPQAKVVVPVAGACYAMLSSGVSAGDDKTTSCTGAHDVETVYVGTFAGADAGRSTAPAKGSTALVAAYADCRKNATTYLGDDFDLGMLDLTMVLPTAPAWTGGARWYRCDIVRYQDIEFKTVGGQGSVKDGLRGDRPLAVTCVTVTDDGKSSITDEQAVACSTPHNAEVAGLFTAPDVPWPADQTARDNMASKGCEGVASKYLGESGGQVNNPLLGWSWDGFTQERWELGDRTTRCLLVGIKGDSANSVRFTGSVKGIGTKAPK
jgi:hypothetical protein